MKKKDKLKKEVDIIEKVIEENKELLIKLSNGSEVVLNKEEPKEALQAVGPIVLGPPVGFTDLLDSEMMERAKNEKKSYFPLRPSSAGYCSRRLAFDLMQYNGFANYPQPPTEPNITRLLSLGNSVEYSALKNLELIPGIKLRYKQQTVSMFHLDDAGPIKGPLIEGSIDTVLWSDEYKAVLDVKSAKDGFSAFYKTRWDETLEKFNNMSSLYRIGDVAYYADNVENFLEELGSDFLTDNIWQLNLYACTQFLRERGIDHAIIYKYNKNDSRHYEIRFRPSMALYERTRKKFNDIYQAVMVHKDPMRVPCDNRLGTMKAAFGCSPGCHDVDALKAWYANLPKKEWPTDIHKTANPNELDELFNSYAFLEDEAKQKDIFEGKIIDAMEKQKLKKIKLTNGRIYEIKLLKSPTPHLELRRTKL